MGISVKLQSPSHIVRTRYRYSRNRSGMAMKTRDKILSAALGLFNKEGERAVTTNHIAAHLGISPGNLYYHFRNKEAIILALFEQFQGELVKCIVLPGGRPITLGDKKQYLEAMLECLWEYRFIFRDLHGAIARSEELQKQFRAFARVCLEMIDQVFHGQERSGLMDATEEEMNAPGLNTFMVLASRHELVNTLIPSQPEPPRDPEPGDLSGIVTGSGVYYSGCPGVL